MTLQDIETHLATQPIPGVTWRTEDGWIHLSVGPIWARATIDDDGDGFVAVFDDKGMRGFGESFFNTADLRPSLRTVCAAYLRRSERPNPYAVNEHIEELSKPGLYAEVLREALTVMRDNLHLILSENAQ